jgi:UDP-N-acetyl-D-glucosamine dehydrogenase
LLSTPRVTPATGLAQACAATCRALLQKIEAGTARAGVIGLGYVGLPLAVEFAKHFDTVGIEVDAGRAAAVNAARSYIGDVPDAALAAAVAQGRLRATTDFGVLAELDCIVICVPTPLEAGKQPDMTYILGAAREIAQQLRPGQLVVLESTTYPGTTDETLLPMFEARGLKLDDDFLLAFSPERVDPGNPNFKIGDIPKIVGGCSPGSSAAAAALYERIVPHVHRVSSARVAETAKLWENIFRAVNIGLANEMALLCHHLGIESGEVIEAAATKPFGFMAFRPGPGVGGHCIPLDPHYLSWTASKHGYYPRFIMLADQINSAMPEFIVQLVNDALNGEGIAMSRARVLVLGVAYKEDVEDMRNSPAISVIQSLRSKGAEVRYHDPFIPRMQTAEDEQPPAPRRDLRPDPYERRQPVSPEMARAISKGRRSVDPLVSYELTDGELRSADCVLILTAHTGVDYARVARVAKLVVDSRNVIGTPAQAGARIVTL